jgi:dolichyl-phosphate beta-glucosyltransferase
VEADRFVTDSARPALSIVVPAYNESKRLPSTLEAIRQYALRSTSSVEVIVVDDGSDDETLSIARSFQPESAAYRVISAPHRGKASAVRTGVLAASGATILFTDADLSTPIDYADHLMTAIEAGADIAVGSREGAGARRVGEPGYRHVMGRVFNGIVRTLAVPGIEDTQCGFKAFRGPVAHDLFNRARLYLGDEVVAGPRVTGFDVELLFLARRDGLTIVEVPVYWKHVPGSKVRPFRDALAMLWDVVHVRYFAARGRYD